MPSKNLGRVSIVPKGTWNTNTVYNRLDAVVYDGSSWLAKKQNIGQQPMEASDAWQLLAERGADGRQGVDGEPGKGLTIISHFDTVESLGESVLSPEPGDAYSVGIVEPYDIYTYDALSLSWFNNGPIKGDQGPAGPKGDTGDIGPQGPKGDTGDIGPQGPKGDTGDPGPQGPKGDTGDVGPQGPKGDTGDTGPQGPQGEPGKGLDIKGTVDSELSLPLSAENGDVWNVGTMPPYDLYLYNGGTWTNLGPLQGPVGPQGPKGDTGDPGPQGPKGDTGDHGPQGPKGDTGDVGPQGPKGDTGDPGPQGPKGDTGDVGPQGPKGDTGEAGPQGPKGDPGDTGPQGPKGDPGDTGPQGPKGDTGDPGPQGPAGADASVTAENIETALGYIPGKISIDLLWENASVGSDFPNQTISLDLSLYKNVRILFSGYNQSQNITIYARDFVVGKNGYIFIITDASNSAYVNVIGREIYISENGIRFADAYAKRTNSATATIANYMLVPVYIYGIKGV